jgi:hypothetical protein
MSLSEKWSRFSDKDMLPKFLKWREFFSIRWNHLIGKRAKHRYFNFPA